MDNLSQSLSESIIFNMSKQGVLCNWLENRLEILGIPNAASTSRCLINNILSVMSSEIRRNVERYMICSKLEDMQEVYLKIREHQDEIRRILLNLHNDSYPINILIEELYIKLEALQKSQNCPRYGIRRAGLTKICNLTASEGWPHCISSASYQEMFFNSARLHEGPTKGIWEQCSWKIINSTVVKVLCQQPNIQPINLASLVNDYCMRIIALQFNTAQYNPNRTKQNMDNINLPSANNIDLPNERNMGQNSSYAINNEVYRSCVNCEECAHQQKSKIFNENIRALLLCAASQQDYQVAEMGKPTQETANTNQLFCTGDRTFKQIPRSEAYVTLPNVNYVNILLKGPRNAAGRNIWAPTATETDDSWNRYFLQYNRQQNNQAILPPLPEDLEVDRAFKNEKPENLCTSERTHFSPVYECPDGLTYPIDKTQETIKYRQSECGRFYLPGKKAPYMEHQSETSGSKNLTKGQESIKLKHKLDTSKPDQASQTIDVVDINCDLNAISNLDAAPDSNVIFETDLTSYCILKDTVKPIAASTRISELESNAESQSVASNNCNLSVYKARSPIHLLHMLNAIGPRRSVEPDEEKSDAEERNEQQVTMCNMVTQNNEETAGRIFSHDPTSSIKQSCDIDAEEIHKEKNDDELFFDAETPDQSTEESSDSDKEESDDELFFDAETPNESTEESSDSDQEESDDELFFDAETPNESTEESSDSDEEEISNEEIDNELNSSAEIDKIISEMEIGDIEVNDEEIDAIIKEYDEVKLMKTSANNINVASESNMRQNSPNIINNEAHRSYVNYEEYAHQQKFKIFNENRALLKKKEQRFKRRLTYDEDFNKHPAMHAEDPNSHLNISTNVKVDFDLDFQPLKGLSPSTLYRLQGILPQHYTGERRRDILISGRKNEYIFESTLC